MMTSERKLESFPTMNWKQNQTKQRGKALSAAILALSMACLANLETGAWSQASAGNAYPLDHRNSNNEMGAKITAPFTVAAVGDLIAAPIYSSDPRFKVTRSYAHTDFIAAGR